MYFALQLLLVPAFLSAVLLVVAPPLLLWAYRRRVGVWMGASAGGDLAAPEPAAGAAGATPAPRWTVFGAPAGDGVRADPALLAPARSQRVRTAIAYGAGGVAHGIFMTAVFAFAHRRFGSELVVLAALAVFLLPAAATVLTLLVVRRGRRAALLAAAVLLALAPLGIAQELAWTLVTFYVLVPALLLLVFTLRLWRSVVPVLLPAVVLGSVAWVLGAQLSAVFGGGDGLRWLLRLGGFAAGFMLGTAALHPVQRALERRRLGETQLFVDAWWWFHTVYLTLVFVFSQQHLAYFVVLLAFALMWAVRHAVRSAAPPDATPGRRLLLLRVFDQGPRTEALFERLEAAWLPLGGIDLIAGRDLALRNIGVADFVAFVTGALRQQFVGSRQALAARLAGGALQRDPDGRFGVEHFWCLADSWRAVMRALAGRADVVLMDLRGFDAQREGCAYELQHLARSARDRPVVLLVGTAAEAEAVRTLLGAQEAPGAPWRLVFAGGGADIAPLVVAAAAAPAARV
jgi:hypothetical protein